MGCLAVGEARGWPAQGVKAGSQPSRPRPQVHAAEFCQHEAESRAEPEQRSGQDIISAGRARARGWMGGKGWEVGGGVLASDCLPRRHQPARRCNSASQLLLAPTLGGGGNPRVSDRLWGYWRTGLAQREAVVQPRAPALPPHLLPGPSPCLPRPRLLVAWRPLPRLRRPPPRGSSRGGGGARSGAGVAAPGGAGAALLRKQPREGILGAGPAPSRARGAAPHAARVTGWLRPAAPAAARRPRVGGRPRRRRRRGRSGGEKVASCSRTPAPGPRTRAPLSVLKLEARVADLPASLDLGEEGGTL